LFLVFWIFATPRWLPDLGRPKDSALDILKRRYASGAISKEEYLERKNILETTDRKE